MSRRRTWGVRALVIAAVLVVVAMLAGNAWLIRSGQTDAQATVRKRFVTRGGLTAELIGTTIADIEQRESRAVESHEVDGHLDAAGFAALVHELDVQAAVYLDGTGHLLDVFPAKPSILGTKISDQYAHLAAAVAGRTAVSNVVPSAAQRLPAVGVAVPIDGPLGRTVFSGGYFVPNTQVGEYVRHALTQKASATYLIDANNVLVSTSNGLKQNSSTRRAPGIAHALSAAAGSTGTFHAGDDQQFFTSAAVPGTTWRIVQTVPTSSLYATANGAAVDVAWVLLAGFTCAATGVGILLYVLGRRRRTLALANARLEAKQAEVHELRDYEQEFVARSSHELRTPLTSVIGYVDELRDGPDPLTAEQRLHLDVVERNARRLQVLVNDLMVLNETELHNLAANLDLEPTGARRLLAPVVAEYETICARAGLRFDVETADAVPAVLVDRSRTEQVLTNLLANAVKFTPPGGSVGVHVRPSGHDVQIVVWDTGMGIAAHELDQVFDRFFRSAMAGKRRIPGNGLGLPIARAIAEAQGGTLTVTSRPGTGSVFTLTVPVSRTAAPAVVALA